MKKLKIRDGFKGEKVIYIPEKILRDAKEKALELFHIYITQIGYFPNATNHYRERGKGCHENILIYCVQGKGYCVLDHKQHEVNANQFILIPATTKYICYWADEADPWSIYWLHYTSDKITLINQLLNIKISNPPTSFALNEEAITMWQNIYSTLEMGYSHEHLISASFSLYYLLAIFLFPKYNTGGHNEGNMITRTIEYMRSNLHTQLSVEEIAANSYLSVSHFSYLFKKTTGVSPVDYFIQLKLQKACQLLFFGTKHIKEIATELGYDNPYYFSRLFKKYIGKAPKEYRRPVKNRDSLYPDQRLLPTKEG